MTTTMPSRFFRFNLENSPPPPPPPLLFSFFSLFSPPPRFLPSSTTTTTTSMADAMEVERSAAAAAPDPKGKAKAAAAPAALPAGTKRFEVKKWNAVAMWSWAICTDTCAICRNNLYEPSIEYQANPSGDADHPG